MSGLAGPRNCTRPGPFEASLPIPVYPPQQFLVPLGPRASCLSIRPSCYVRLSTAFAETPIVPNSSVCFVLPCYYAVLAPAYAIRPPRKRQAASDLENGTLRHSTRGSNLNPTCLERDYLLSLLTR